MTRLAPTLIRAPLLARTARLAVLAAVPIVTGCAPFVASSVAGGTVGAVATAGTPEGGYGSMPTGAAVAVALDPPRDMAVFRAAGDTAWVRGARTLVGRVRAVRGDTVWVALTEVSGSSGRIGFSRTPESTAAVIRDDQIRVDLINRRPAMTEGAAIGAAVGFIVALIFLIVYCTTDVCLS